MLKSRENKVELCHAISVVLWPSLLLVNTNSSEVLARMPPNVLFTDGSTAGQISLVCVCANVLISQFHCCLSTQ